MHNCDDKYPGFEPGTCKLKAPVDTTEPSGQAKRVRLNSNNTFLLWSVFFLLPPTRGHYMQRLRLLTVIEGDIFINAVAAERLNANKPFYCGVECFFLLPPTREHLLTALFFALRNSFDRGIRS